MNEFKTILLLDLDQLSDKSQRIKELERVVIEQQNRIELLELMLMNPNCNDEV